MKGLKDNLCTHGGDMLAYLYDEMPSADRETFELHLADCGTCIDDFAELSQSRYPVYEWKQTEFDPLLTPRIVIPYGEPTQSWFDKVRAAFAFNPGLAFGAAASLLIAVAAGYFVMSRPNVDLARDVEPSPSPTRMATNPPPVDRKIPEAVAKEGDAKVGKPVATGAVTPAKTSPKVVKAKTTVPMPKKNDRVPVYSTVDDDEDDSLRLSDIFAELDTSE